MSKYQEALDKLRRVPMKFGQDLYDYSKEEIDILQELVNKETPTKPVIINNFELPPYKGKAIVCPHCKVPLGISVKRCRSCGQKIDWSNFSGS